MFNAWRRLVGIKKKKTEVANGLESAWKEKGYLQAH
jgi:hypothetical protein